MIVKEAWEIVIKEFTNRLKSTNDNLFVGNGSFKEGKHTLEDEVILF